MKKKISPRWTLPFFLAGYTVCAVTTHFMDMGTRDAIFALVGLIASLAFGFICGYNVGCRKGE